MNIPIRLGVFALALVVVFGAAYGVGGWADPVGADNESHQLPATAGGPHEPAGGHGSTDPAMASGPGGLAVSADGYTIRLAGDSPTAGRPVEFAFQIVDDHQAPVIRFAASHEKQLHLVVVRRDLTGFQHLHPQMATDGTWRTPLALDRPGDWRVFADFVPEVRDGAPVTDLQPYLGAYGHLVALRAGDLGYLHVHPQQTETAGPAIAFEVEVATAGTYRLFLDFQHGGVVRTASFTGEAS